MVNSWQGHRHFLFKERRKESVNIAFKKFKDLTLKLSWALIGTLLCIFYSEKAHVKFSVKNAVFRFSCREWKCVKDLM